MLIRESLHLVGRRSGEFASHFRAVDCESEEAVWKLGGMVLGKHLK